MPVDLRTGLVTLVVERKLPDDVTLTEYMRLVGAIRVLHGGAIWAIVHDLDSVPSARDDSEDEAQLLQAQYGSDFLVAIGIAGGLATIAVALTKAVKNLAEAAKASAEATKAMSETDKAIAETTAIWESLNSRGRSDIARAQSALSTSEMRETARAIVAEELRKIGLDRAAESVLKPDGIKPEVGVSPGQLADAVRYLAAYDPNLHVYD